MTLNPSFCRIWITPLQLKLSAQAPWMSTIVGFGARLGQALCCAEAGVMGNERAKALRPSTTTSVDASPATTRRLTVLRLFVALSHPPCARFRIRLMIISPF